MGAWIEIRIAGMLLTAMGVAPVWGRGLKYVAELVESHVRHVTPRVGAWIEMRSASQSRESTVCHPPAWGRGLKFHVLGAHLSELASPPAWGCGLKFDTLAIKEIVFECCPRVGAWIEMTTSCG